MPDIVSVDQVIGKDLWAKKKVNAMNRPSDFAGVMKEIGAGEKVGRVYSWVWGKDSNGNNTDEIFWMIDKDTNKPYFTYVKHNPSAFSWKDLKQQGALTVEEEIEEEEEKDMSFTDKIWRDIKKTAKPVLIVGGILGVTYAGVKIYKAYKA